MIYLKKERQLTFNCVEAFKSSFPEVGADFLEEAMLEDNISADVNNL